MPDPKPVRVLSIAGSDSGGGAGIQADIKTITALGGYAMTAITALTAQNTKSIESIVPVAPEFVALQIRMCLEDIGADAIKIGMLPSAEAVQSVCEVLDELAGGIPVILDPIMSATTGVTLARQTAFEEIKTKLLGRTELITPNLAEAEMLTGETITGLGDMKRACNILVEDMGVSHVLLTGGHLEGDVVRDVLMSPSLERVYSSPKIATSNTHGTGCTLSSAIATELAFGKDMEDAVLGAIGFVRSAIEAAEDLGQGNGPLNHQFDIKRK